MRQQARYASALLLGWSAFIVAWYEGAFENAAEGAVSIRTPHPDPPWEHNKDLLHRREIAPIVRKDQIELDAPVEDLAILKMAPIKNLTDEWMQGKQEVWKLIILFQHNLPILLQAVASFRRASKIMIPNIIVVDNSLTKEAVHSRTLYNEVFEVVPTARLLNFPELHNFMADIAMARHLEFFFWAHADNYVLPASEGRDLGYDVLSCMKAQIKKTPNWGMLLFSYDHLAAFRTQTMVQIPWDPLIFQYGSECDVYGRIRDAGYEAKACKVHLSYDMKQVLNITDDMSYTQIKAVLETDAQDKRGRNQWRENAMDWKEQEWRKEMKLASREYLVSKWLQRGCKVRGLPCHKPWPYCPKCPLHIPDCFIKRPERSQLEHIHKETRKVFATNEEQPIAYEQFVPSEKEKYV